MLRKKRKKFLMPRIRIRGIRARRLRLRFLPPPKNLPSAVLPPSGESVRNRKTRVRGMLRRKTIGVRAPASKRPHGRRLPHRLVKFGLFLRQYPRRRPRRRQIREQLRDRRRPFNPRRMRRATADRPAAAGERPRPRRPRRKKRP